MIILAMSIGPWAANVRPNSCGNARCPSSTGKTPPKRPIRIASGASLRSGWIRSLPKKGRPPCRLPTTVLAIEVFAPAKINLSLHVTGQRDDGYHLLDSLVMFADVGDRITVERATGTKLTITGPMSDGVPATDDNLVLRAARLMGIDAKIHLEKVLPHAAGLGGGSSDAAATLRALAGLTGQPIPDNVVGLGADVPVCLGNLAARMRGIGEDVKTLHG